MQLTDSHIRAYDRDRHIRLPGFFEAGELARHARAVADRVAIMNRETRPLEARDTYGKAFLQCTNLWVKDEAVRELVFDRRLADTAARLMGTRGVRLYHDQALAKEPGGGITPWHADQYYWPLATDKVITAWIPLQETPLEMGALEFASGSHRLLEGRDLAISDRSEEEIGKRMKIGDFPHVAEPFAAGDVSFHSGWVFHRAGANRTDRVRHAMTIIYMDIDMVLKEPENDHQRLDWQVWCPGAEIGKVIDTPLNPVV